MELSFLGDYLFTRDSLPTWPVSNAKRGINREMWLPHRNAVIRHNCLHSPLKDDDERYKVNRKLPQHGPHDAFYLCLKTPCYVDYRKPKYNAFKYIAIDPSDKYEASRDCKGREATRGIQENLPIGNVITPEEKWWNDKGDKNHEVDSTTSGDIETGTMAWMWDGFCVDDYTPKPEIKTVIPKAVESKPKVTVPEPFQMTLREEERKRRPKEAWEEVRVEPQKPPLFKASPIPRTTRLCLYDKMVQECEKQRQLLHQKRRKFLLAVQCPFGFGDGKLTSPEKPTKRAAASAEAKPTFKPAINPNVPDFSKLHHTFENRLKHVRQKRQSTVPQPFSFQASEDREQQQTTTCLAKEPLKTVECQSDTKKSGGTKTTTARSPRHTKAALLREGAVRKKLTTEAAKRMEYENPRSDIRAKLQKEVGLWISAQKCLSSANEKRKQYYRMELRARSADYRAELAEMKERVSRRPLLLQSLYDPDLSSCVILEHAVLDDLLCWNQAKTGDQNCQLQLES